MGGPNPLYLLEEISSGYRAARAVGLSAAPRGMCLNQAPTVRAPRQVEATAGEPIELRAFVADDGLPREGTLVVRWSAPEGVRVEAPDAATTRAVFAGPGSYTLTVQVDDGAEQAEAAVEVRVGPTR